MNYLLYLCLLLLVVWLWAVALRTREQLLRFCRETCRDAGYQFLDETVVLESLTIRKGTHGLPVFCRRYRFEVSEDGTDRYQGYVVLSGSQITSFFLHGRHHTEILH